MLFHFFFFLFFFFNDTATTEIYTLSLHDALPTWRRVSSPVIALLPAQLAQGGPQHRGHVHRVAAGAADHALLLKRGDGLVGVPGRPAQVDQAGLYLVAPGGGPRRRLAW